MDVRRIGLSLLLLTGTAHADVIPEGADVNPDPPPSGGCSCEVSAPKIVKLRGTVISKWAGEPAAGATIVVGEHGGKGVYTAITDELGNYTLEISPGSYDVTLYYLDVTRELASNRLILDDLELAPTMIDDRSTGYTCWYISPWVPPVEITSMPRFGGVLSRELQPVSRDRTHLAWISPVAFADPTRAATNVEGGRRFTTAPGIPLAFVQDVTTYSRDVPIEYASGGGGATDVTLRAGNNERHGEARMIAGADDHDGKAQGEAYLAGPLRKDHAWAAAGLVVQRDRGQLASDGMLRLDAQSSVDHSFMLAGLAHQAGDEQAGWSAARWKGKFRDGKLEIGAMATAELLDRPREIAAAQTPIDPGQHVDRLGGIAFAKLRMKAAGYHTMYASAASGIGTRDDVRHSDASYIIGDDWMWTPSLSLTTGVRVEQRMFDGDRATVVAPRAAIKWDPTKEGRSELFVGYQRVPLVDDGLPGDWKSLDDTSADEVAAGASYKRSSGNTMIGASVRHRDDQTGGDAWVRRETSRSVLIVQATSLERVATLIARRKLRDRNGLQLTAGAAARVSEERSEAGAAVTFKHSPSRQELTTEIAAEAYEGTAGPGARIVVGILW